MSVFGWVLLAVGALAVGFSKTALSGVASLAVALFATVLPVKASTGALLVLLLFGDLIAITVYHRHVAWRDIGRMAPSILVGLAAGVWFLRAVGGTAVKLVIAIILAVLVCYQAFGTVREIRRSRAAERPVSGAGPAADARNDRRGEPAGVRPAPARRHGLAALRAGYGVLGGFGTMAANAGGVPMTLYLMAAHLPKQAFLATTAWLFFLINVVKLPFSIGLGLITPEALKLCAPLVPSVVVGALAGRLLIRRVGQRRFDFAVLIVTAAAVVMLFV